MSESYERERQNNSRLDELSAKVSALRGVTIDIYDNARDQAVIDNTVRLLYDFSLESIMRNMCSLSLSRSNFRNPVSG